MAFINDGHPTRITFDALGSGVTLLIEEKTVTPPGISAGGGNDVTSMLNEVWRTKQPKHLKELTDCACSFKYDPGIYSQILTIIGVNGQIVITFPDLSTLTFWGWLDNFTPGECAEGQPSIASGTIICGNQDNDSVEQAPVYAAAV